MVAENHPLFRHYDEMWRRSWPEVRRGSVEMDLQLFGKAADGRRCLTLLARLAPDVARNIVSINESLAAFEPDQYYYPERDIHLTVLSLFTATSVYERELERRPDYLAAVRKAVKATRPFSISSIGVTLSTSAIIVQGFPDTNALNETRDRIRDALQERGLGASVDERYRLVTAHSTCARFAAPLRRPETFADALARLRNHPFGASNIESFQLVLNDWYMSSETLVPIESFDLRA